MSLYYKINGVKMPGFTSFEPEDNHLYGENTGRDEAGFNHLDLIRANVKKWKIQHHMITRAELDLIKSTAGPLACQVEALTSSGYVEATCYANIQNEKLLFYDNAAPAKSYWACDVSLIEM